MTTAREWAKIIIPGLALLAASTAAVVAYLQFNQARLSAERQDRAYVFQKTGSYRLDQWRRPVIEINLENFGKTPAFDIVTTDRCYVGPYPINPSEVRQIVRDQKGTTAAPGGGLIVAITCNRAITPDEEQAMKDGKFAVYVSSSISYRDAFGKARNTSIRRIVGGEPAYRDDMLGVASEGDTAD